MTLLELSPGAGARRCVKERKPSELRASAPPTRVTIALNGPALAGAGPISCLEKARGEDFGRRSRTICSTVGRSCGRNFCQFSGSHEYAPRLAISDGINGASKKNTLVAKLSG